MSEPAMPCRFYDQQRLSELLDQSEGAAFIVYPDRFRANVEALKSAFEARYKRIGLGYSYKTNHLPQLCLEAHRLGLYAEVVSGSEYHIARQLGVAGNRILFNGPAKTGKELMLALSQGSLVNVDSLDEACQIARIAATFDGQIRLGLRCNLDIQWKDRHSRFGLSEQSGELDAAWNLLQKCENVRVEGLHCHTSFDRSAASYRRRVLRLIEIADRLFQKEDPDFIDVGGGLCGPMSEQLRRQMSVQPPDFEEYAEAICLPMLERYGSQGPELILEPGVGLLGDVFDYVFRVERIKQVGAGWFAVTSGAAHHVKIVPNNVNLPLSIYERNAQDDGRCSGTPIDVVGYTCLEHDILYRGFNEPLSAGDILVMNNVGAYSMVSSPDFIRTSPPVYQLTEAGWTMLRRKVSIDDYLKNFDWQA